MQEEIKNYFDVKERVLLVETSMSDIRNTLKELKEMRKEDRQDFNDLRKSFYDLHKDIAFLPWKMVGLFAGLQAIFHFINLSGLI